MKSVISQNNSLYINSNIFKVCHLLDLLVWSSAYISFVDIKSTNTDFLQVWLYKTSVGYCGILQKRNSNMYHIGDTKILALGSYILMVRFYLRVAE